MLKGSKFNAGDNVQVVVRVRPPIQRQMSSSQIFLSTVQTLEDQKTIQLFQYYNLQNVSKDELEMYIDDVRNFNRHQFTFDHVYDDEASQQQVYKNTARLSVCSALQGYNATIFAYGQTGTGKTYTMQGFKYNLTDQCRGIIPRAIQDIFKYIQSCDDDETTFMVRASYIQIYNQVVSDLLRSQRKNLLIREDPKKGVYVEGVSQWAVVKPQQIVQLIKIGTKSRAIAKTNMNQTSSRSHAIFIITIQQMKVVPHQTEGRQIKVAKLNLVDLAGSQRVRVSGATGKQLQQCKKINLSLSCLGQVINALTQSKPNSHVPYRNSLLTRLISDSLGGNCKTTMLTMISPAAQAFLQSLSTLKFASRAKKIKNKPLVNEDLDQKALIRKYQNELNRLRSELDQKNKILIDKSKLIQLQQEKKKIEEDKNIVMRALQEKSHQFFKERQQKKLLEQKIKAFNSQLIHTGKDSLEKVFEQQKKIIKQYEHRIKNLEQEKGSQRFDNSNLDEQLFEKQNNILMTLAAKLNQRDEVNMHLNQQLCAYDRITKQTQQTLQRKNQRIDRLQKLLKKHKIPIPQEQQQLRTEKRQAHLDGVYLQGQMTYNITQKNLVKTKQQVNVLKQMNGQQKQQINRLKQQLKMKDCEQSHISRRTQTDIQGYKKIKDSIQMITNGLQKKQNTDMKSIISQIFKIRKIVNDNINNVRQ